jgi:hypothetical protein
LSGSRTTALPSPGLLQQIEHHLTSDGKITNFGLHNL